MTAPEVSLGPSWADRRAAAALVDLLGIDATVATPELPPRAPSMFAAAEPATIDEHGRDALQQHLDMLASMTGGTGTITVRTAPGQLEDADGIVKALDGYKHVNLMVTDEPEPEPPAPPEPPPLPRPSTDPAVCFSPFCGGTVTPGPHEADTGQCGSCGLVYEGDGQRWVSTSGEVHQSNGPPGCGSASVEHGLVTIDVTGVKGNNVGTYSVNDGPTLPWNWLIAIVPE